MTSEPEMETAIEPSPPAGAFYFIGPDIFAGGPGHGLTFANLERLLTPPRQILRPKEGGFPPLREKPYLVQDSSKKDVALRDLEASFSGYWLVSQRLKDLFSGIAPNGFAFAACDVEMSDGTLETERYLCDVLPVVDALDEDRSKLEIRIGDEYAKGKHYYIGNGAALFFDADSVGSAHIFRTPWSSHVFCDRALRDAIKDGGFTGIGLEDASDY